MLLDCDNERKIIQARQNPDQTYPKGPQNKIS